MDNFNVFVEYFQDNFKLYDVILDDRLWNYILLSLVNEYYFVAISTQSQITKKTKNN